MIVAGFRRCCETGAQTGVSTTSARPRRGTDQTRTAGETAVTLRKRKELMNITYA
jgi:hypothetical protein